MPDAVHGCVDAVGTALAPEFETLAERFAASGYRTAGFYAGPYLHEVFGLGQGFEVYRYCVEDEGGLDPERRDEWANDPDFHHASHGGVTNDRVWDAASAWLEEHQREPFFLFLHFWDVHYDFTPPGEWATRFDPDYQGSVDGRDFAFDERIAPDMPARDLAHLVALYDGEIGWTDTFIGRLREALSQWQLADRTVIAITSDHGTEFFEHGWKGHRRTLYDEVLHVPFVLWYPSGLPAGSVVRDQTRSIDVAPTLCELAGIPAPAASLGASLVGLARGGTIDFDNTAVSELATVGLELRSVRTERDKLVHDARAGGDPARWFDLERDPRERRPLALDAGRGPEVQARFLRMIGVLEQAIATRPGGPVRLELPEDIREDLRGLGYLDLDDDR